MKRKNTAAAAAVALLSMATLAACSSTSEPTTASGPTSASGATSSGACEPAGGPVTLDFTTWIPGIEGVVDMWNQANPDIQVNVQTGPNGNGGTYKNFFNQIEAGNAPDLGQIEYDALPNFRGA